MKSYPWLRFYGGLQVVVGVVVLLAGGALTVGAAASSGSGGVAIVVLVVGTLLTLLAALIPMAIGEAVSALLRIVEIVEGGDHVAGGHDDSLPDRAPPFCPECNEVLGASMRTCPRCSTRVSAGTADSLPSRVSPPPGGQAE